MKNWELLWEFEPFQWECPGFRSSNTDIGLGQCAFYLKGPDNGNGPYETQRLFVEETDGQEEYTFVPGSGLSCILRCPYII